MNSDSHATFPEEHHNLTLLMSPLTDFEDGEDFAAMGSGASVASSEWRNVSSSSSSSSVEAQLTVKEYVSTNLSFFFFIVDTSTQHRELACVLGSLVYPSPCHHDRHQEHFPSPPFMPRHS